MRCLAALAIGLVAATSAAQPVASNLESRLPTLQGAERAHALTELTERYRNDRPHDAVRYGEDALAWYAAHADPVNEVRTLNELAWAHMILSDYPRAVTLATRARELSEARKDRRGAARAINNLGAIAQRRGDAVTAVDLFNRSLAMYRDLGTQGDIARELNNLGFVYSTMLGDYDRALALQLEALAIREKANDPADLALSMQSLGIVYARTGNSQKALESFQRSLDLRRDSGADNRIAATLTYMSDVYVETGARDKAAELLEQARALRMRVGDEQGTAVALVKLGRVQVDLGRPAVAERHFREALALAEKVGDRTAIVDSLVGLADTLRRTGRASGAIPLASRAVSVAEETPVRDALARALESLSAAQAASGQPGDALDTFRRFKAESDRVFADDRERRLATLRQQYEVEQRLTAAERLKNEQVARDRAAERQRLQRNLAIVAAVLLVLAGTSIYRRRQESIRVAEQLSITDALTGLKNRRFVLQTIVADLAAADRRRRNAPPGVAPTDADIVFVLIDLDKFKAVNDRYGHRAGDAVLTQTAHVLRGICRLSDTIARWGGEEFLLISRFTDRRNASILAERIRTEIAQNLFELGDGRTIRCTCSVGYASYPFSTRHPDLLTWDQIVAIADEALYMAKRGGANAWIGAAASDIATDEQLRRLQQKTAENLAQLMAEGVILRESAQAPPQAPAGV